jgi:hypothetical protein
MMERNIKPLLSGTPTTYKPGIGSNRPSFLDIEYQNYGWVGQSKEDENRFY